MNSRRIVFLINPVAGTRQKDGLEDFLVKACHREGIEYMIVHSARSTSVPLLQMQLHDFGATDLVACGGDGTVNLAAATVAHSDISLGIIPVGSGNGLARTAGIPLRPSKAFEILLQGERQLTDAFSVNGEFACMLSGVGLDAAVAERFAHSHRRGLMTYTTETLLQFFRAHPFQFEVSMGDFSFFTDAFFISVANSNQFGNNVTIAPRASLTDGLLDVIIVQKMPKAGLPFALWQQVRGNNRLRSVVEQIGSRHILYFQTPSLNISNPKHAPLHIDGEPHEIAESLHFEMIPRAFHLWVPQRASVPSRRKPAFSSSQSVSGV